MFTGFVRTCVRVSQFRLNFIIQGRCFNFKQTLYQSSGLLISQTNVYVVYCRYTFKIVALLLCLPTIYIIWCHSAQNTSFLR